ncbi:RED family protein [Babesia caballi]|uniref:RED family protein n=1 Tax=Babesia caballi TaxID=5871 RepID=A0AAV4LPC5_BABCB|nr:RED family protein [Babesia caballi]
MEVTLEGGNKRRRRRRLEEPERAPEGVYRDRALERSQLKDEYYRKVVEEHALLRAQTEEESRYMVRMNACLSHDAQGGDEEHTHLVKGLDYVLLEKVRKSLEPRAAAERAAQVASAAAQEEVGHTDFGRYIYRTFLYHTHMHHRHFRDRLMKTYSLVCKGYKFRRAAAAARTFYTFDLRMEPSANDVPSILVSNEDAGRANKLADEMRACLAPEIRRELAETLEWHRENRKKPKEERLSMRPQHVASRDSGDESDDIFADAGEYRGDELNLVEVSRLKANEKYFADSEDDADPGNSCDGAPRLQAFGRRRRLAATTDGYDECYPCTGDVDSDDDVRGGAKKPRGNRAEWRKIEQIIADKGTVPMEQLEQIAGSQKSKQQTT